MQYELKIGTARATVDTLGGMLTAYSGADGQPCLWTGDAAYWTGHAPLLFPIVGAVKNGEIKIDGKCYPMQKHGFARFLEHRLLAHNETSASFVMENSGSTRKSFPHAFRLVSTYKLLSNGFSVMYTVTNIDHDPISFCIGGHPGFCCPMHPEESFSDYEIVFEDTEDPVLVYTDTEGIIHPEIHGALLSKNTLKLRYDLFDRDVLILPTLKSRKILLKNAKTNHGISLFVKQFHSLGIWTVPYKKAPFLCIEPWQGLPDYANDSRKMENKPGVVQLQPEQKYSCGFVVKQF